jgi:hypothetical protein
MDYSEPDWSRRFFFFSNLYFEVWKHFDFVWRTCQWEHTLNTTCLSPSANHIRINTPLVIWNFSPPQTQRHSLAVGQRSERNGSGFFFPQHRRFCFWLLRQGSLSYTKPSLCYYQWNTVRLPYISFVLNCL